MSTQPPGYTESRQRVSGGSMAAVDRAIEVDELVAQWMLLDHEGDMLSGRAGGSVSLDAIGPDEVDIANRRPKRKTPPKD